MKKDGEIENLQCKLSEISKELHMERKTTQALRTDHLNYEKNMKKLQEDLASKQVSLSNLEDDCIASGKEIEELHSKIVAQANELEELKALLVEAEHNTKEMEAERDAFDDENVGLKKQITEKAKESESERISNERQIKLLEEKIDKLTSLGNSLGKSASDAMIAAKGRENVLQYQMNDYKTRLEKKEKEKEDVMTAAHRNIENLKMEKMKLAKENSTLKENLQKMTEGVNAGLHESSQQLLLRDSEITALKEKVQKLDALKKKSNDALSETSSRMTILQNQVNCYNTNLEEKKNAMTMAYRNIEALKADKSKVEKINISLEEKCAKLESELGHLTASRDNFASKVKSLEKENNDLIDKSENLNRNNEQISKSLDEEKERREVQQIDLEREKNSVLSALELKRKEIEELNIKLDKSNEEKKETEEKLQTLLVNKENELKKSSERCQDLADNMKSLKKKELNLQSQNACQIETLENKVRGLEKKVKIQEKLIKDLKEEMKSSIKTTEMMSLEVREKDNLLKHYEEDLMPFLRRGIGSD